MGRASEIPGPHDGPSQRRAGWPAREIRRLRRELETRDGAGFDLKAFPDELPGQGSLPLATLSRELPHWVAAPA